MLNYYAIYENSTTEPPVGIIALEPAEGDALIWDHMQEAWSYDPWTAVEFLDDFRNFERYEPISREKAEQITPGIADGEKLPDEETILWIFQWKGEPPQHRPIRG